MSVIKYKTKYSSIIPGNYNKTIYRFNYNKTIYRSI